LVGDEGFKLFTLTGATTIVTSTVDGFNFTSLPGDLSLTLKVWVWVMPVTSIVSVATLAIPASDLLEPLAVT